MDLCIENIYLCLGVYIIYDLCCSYNMQVILRIIPTCTVPPHTKELNLKIVSCITVNSRLMCNGFGPLIMLLCNLHFSTCSCGAYTHHVSQCLLLKLQVSVPKLISA